MSLKRIPSTVAQYLVKNKTQDIGLDGKILPWDYDGTNVNRLTNASDRTSRGGWCYSGAYTITVAGSPTITSVIADVKSGGVWTSDVSLAGARFSGNVITLDTNSYKNIRVYTGASILHATYLCEEESDTLAYDISGNGNDGTLSNVLIHSSDDTVTFSDADDRGAGLVAKNLNRAQTIPNTIVLSGAFKARYKFRIYPYFRPFVAGHKYYLTLRGSGITLTLQFLSITPDLDTASIRLINGATNAVYESSGVRVLNTLLTLEVTRDVSNNVTFNLSNDLGESATSGLLPFAVNYEINEFGYLATVLNDWVHGSMESVEIWDGVPFTEGEAEYEYTNFINSNTNTGSAGSTFNLVNKLLIDGIVPLLEDGITPANPNIPQAQYTGAYKPYLQIKNSPALTLEVGNTLTIGDTSLISTIENQGTSVLTVSTGTTITVTAGTAYGVVFKDSGGNILAEIPACEGSGVSFKNAKNRSVVGANYDITAIAGTITNLHSATQQDYHFVQAFGGFDTGSIIRPANLETPNIDVDGNQIANPELIGKTINLEIEQDIDINPESMPKLTQMGYENDGNNTSDGGLDSQIPITSLPNLFGALKARSEAATKVNNLTLFNEGLKGCINLSGTVSNTLTFPIAVGSTFNVSGHKFLFRIPSGLTNATYIFYSLGSVLMSAVIDTSTWEFRIGQSGLQNIIFSTLEYDIWYELNFADGVGFDGLTCGSGFITATLLNIETGNLVEVTPIGNGVGVPTLTTSTGFTPASGLIYQLAYFAYTNGTDEILIPCMQESGVILQEVKGEVLNTSSGRITVQANGTDTNLWNVFQKIYDYGGIYGSELNGGVLYPGLLNDNLPTGISSRNGTSPIDNIQKVLDQQQGLKLIKK
jgi:hypothetical protein